MIDTVLDSDGLVDEAAFFSALTRAIDLPFIAVPETDPKNPPHTRLPARLALRHRVLPGRIENGALQSFSLTIRSISMRGRWPARHSR